MQQYYNGLKHKAAASSTTTTNSGPLVSCIALQPAAGDHEETIVGAVLAQFVKLPLGAETGIVEATSVPRSGGVSLYILTLGVVESHRRQGLAKQLVARCVQIAKQNTNCYAVHLHVLHSNAAAKALYDACGFVLLRRLHSYEVVGWGCVLFVCGVTA